MRLLRSERALRAALIAVTAVLLVAEVALVRNQSGGNAGQGTAIFLATLAVAPLAASRRWPTLAAVAATIIVVALLAVHDTPIAIAPFAVMLFLLARLVIQRGLPVAAPLVLPFIINAASPIDGAQGGLSSALPLLFVLAALVVGESMRKTEVTVAALDESTRAQTVMEERARIARELHDIVAHHLSVITVESEAARLTSPDLSEHAAGRFAAIADTARDALSETRRVLGVLREESDAEAARAPQPGLDGLDDLIDRAEATGTPVRLVREGKIARLPAGIDLAAYRIVQEALTNARRHAPGARVDVELAYRGAELEVHVRDYGPGVANGAPVEGHGLLGMRERATLAGGTFAAGSADGGGFEVLVTLPIDGAAS